MASQHHICERCGAAARIVHHKIHITPGNIGDPIITLDWGNLEAVCQDCHAAEHKPRSSPPNGIAFDENGNPVKHPNVFLVCGSPGSGKSTYVSSNKTRFDLVVDLDYICSALMGEPGNLYLNYEIILSVAIEMRKLLYEIIRSRRGKWERAFVITSAADANEQRAIANEINAEIIMIDTPLEECIERIHADQRRGNKKLLFEQLIRKWFAMYNNTSSFIKSPPLIDNTGASGHRMCGIHIPL